MIDLLPHRPLQSLSGSLVLDRCSGKLYRALLNQSYLLEFLWNARLDCEKMALMHCVLSCGRDPRQTEAKVGVELQSERRQMDSVRCGQLAVAMNRGCFHLVGKQGLWLCPNLNIFSQKDTRIQG